MRKLIMYIKIVVIAATIGCIQQVNAGTQGVPHGAGDVSFQHQILHYVNQYRMRHFLRPLKMSETISIEAEKHSRDMANKSMPFGHTGYTGRMKRLYTKFDHCRGGAENVAYYKTDAKKLVDAWMASPGHRQNIMGGYNLTGIGIAYSKKGWAYYTQIFLRSDGKQVG